MLLVATFDKETFHAYCETCNQTLGGSNISPRLRPSHLLKKTTKTTIPESSKQLQGCFEMIVFNRMCASCAVQHTVMFAGCRYLSRTPDVNCDVSGNVVRVMASCSRGVVTYYSVDYGIVTRLQNSLTLAATCQNPCRSDVTGASYASGNQESVYFYDTAQNGWGTKWSSCNHHLSCSSSCILKCIVLVEQMKSLHYRVRIRHMHVVHLLMSSCWFIKQT